MTSVQTCMGDAPQPLRCLGGVQLCLAKKLDIVSTPDQQRRNRVWLLAQRIVASLKHAPCSGADCYFIHMILIVSWRDASMVQMTSRGYRVR